LLYFFLSTLFSCQDNNKEDTRQAVGSSTSFPTFSQTTDIPKGILTPDVVEISIGTLKFFDGAPLPETVELVFDNLDRMRGVDAFLKGMQGASQRELIERPKAIGTSTKFNKILIFEELMDSKQIFLTGNTSTLYIIPTLDLKAYGPMVVEAPPGLLGGFNSAWFNYMSDIGIFGPDKGKGGKFLVLPPGYDGKIPSGYYVVKSPTYKVWDFILNTSKPPQC